MRKIQYPPTKKMWYVCPVCKTKLVIYDNTAKCTNVFIKCRTCKNEIEIKI